LIEQGHNDLKCLLQAKTAIYFGALICGDDLAGEFSLGAQRL
jgi:hypothetical protein